MEDNNQPEWAKEKNLGHLTMEYYGPSASMEWCDDDGNYYNRSGSRLRSPEEYNPHSEGYTPFGDE
jgi:hypothetical protein